MTRSKRYVAQFVESFPTPRSPRPVCLDHLLDRGSYLPLWVRARACHLSTAAESRPLFGKRTLPRYPPRVVDVQSSALLAVGTRPRLPAVGDGQCARSMTDVQASAECSRTWLRAPVNSGRSRS